MGGNQFTVSGEVTLKTAQAAQGAKQVRSEWWVKLPMPSPIG
jgi:hypothetical protein